MTIGDFARSMATRAGSPPTTGLLDKPEPGYGHKCRPRESRPAPWTVGSGLRLDAPGCLAAGGAKARRLRTVAIPGDAVGRQGCLVENQVGGLLGDHHHRGVDVAVGHVGHDRGVDDPQPFDAMNAQ